MAVAFDATSIEQTMSGATSLSWTHTAAGLNRYGIVAVGGYSGLGVTGVTWGGSAMTALGSQVNAGDGSEVYLYGIVAPATGAQTIVVSMGAGYGAAGSISYTGVDPVAPTGTAVGSNVNGTVTATNSAVSSATGNMVVGAFGSSGTIAPFSSSQNFRFAGIGGLGYTGGANDAAGAASVSSSFTNGNIGASWSLLSIELKASGGAPPAGGLFLPAALNGLGAGGPFFGNPLN